MRVRRGVYEQRVCKRLPGRYRLKGCGRAFWPLAPNQQVCADCAPKLRAAYLLRYHRAQRRAGRKAWTDGEGAA